MTITSTPGVTVAATSQKSEALWTPRVKRFWSQTNTPVRRVGDHYHW